MEGIAHGGILGSLKEHVLLGRLTGRTRNTVSTTDLDGHLRPSVLTATQGSSQTLSSKRVITYNDTYFVPSLITDTQPYGAYSETYMLDGMGRIQSKTISDGSVPFTVSRTLNALGNPLTLTYPSGGGQAARTATLKYDAFVRPQELYLDDASVAANRRALMNYEYDVSGSSFTTLLIFGTSGTASTTTSSKTVMGELRNVTHTNASPAQSNDITWTVGGLMVNRGTDQFDYDPLQRLSFSHVVGLHGEVMEQTYGYDRYGNRNLERYKYTQGLTGIAKPASVRSWNATYDATNSLPTQITLVDPETGVPQGTVSTGAKYDNYGRITEVLTPVNDVDTLTTWGYDAASRVVRENGTTFLLDAEGLRFKRMRADGSVQYTVYGFSREPLAEFEKAAAVKGAALKASTPTMQAASLLPSTRPVIVDPTGNVTVWVGQRIFLEGSDTSLAGTNSILSWAFGDGLKSTGTSAVHSYTTTGTFTVTLTASCTGYSAKTCTLTVTVKAVPVLSLVGTPNGGSGATGWTLTWSANGVDPSWNLTLTNYGTVSASGSVSLASSTTPTSYVLRVSNAYGVVSQTVVTFPAIGSFSGDATSLNVGQGMTLRWSVTNNALTPITSLTVTATPSLGPSAPVVMNVISQTTLSVTPAVSTTYTLTATNAIGASTRTVTISVLQKPVIEAFWATPGQLSSGQGAVLKWGISNYASLSVSGIGTVTGGSVSISPTTTTTYTLTATNAAGMSTASISVWVGPASSSPLTWKRSIVYGFGQLICEEKPYGTFFIQSDQVGSPNMVVDPNGVVQGRAKNLPFGERFGQDGEKSLRRYTNHEDDTDTDAIYMQARTYLPTYGKFAQPDPAYDQLFEDPETWNLYNYVTNNPVTCTDPEGRAAEASSSWAVVDSFQGFSDDHGQMQQIGGSGFGPLSAGTGRGSKTDPNDPNNPNMPNNPKRGDKKTLNGQEHTFDGKEWVASGTVEVVSKSSTQSTKELKPLVVDLKLIPFDKIYGTGTCTDLPKSFGMPNTGQLREGPRVDENTPDGTLVGTLYDNGRYRSEHGKGHVGFKNGFVKGKSLTLKDQYKGSKGVTSSTLRSGNNKSYNSNADNYRVILFPQ